MKVIRDIIETTLRNHGIDYTDEQLDEMVCRASSDGGTTAPRHDAVDRIEWAISPFLGGD